MDKKLQKGIIDPVEVFVGLFLVSVFAASISTALVLLQGEDEKKTHLDPLVKQEIREAVKDGIQAHRDEKLQQLRNLPDESVKARFVHF